MVQNEIQDKVTRYNKERERRRGIECLWGLDSLSLLGQGTIIAWDRTCWRVSRTFYPVCETRLLSFVSVRSWFRREKGWEGSSVCMRTYSTISVAALDRIDMFGTRLPPLADSPDLDTTIHSSRNRKSPARTPLGIVQTFHGVSIIARGQYLPFVPLIEFDGNSGGFQGL